MTFTETLLHYDPTPLHSVSLNNFRSGVISSTVLCGVVEFNSESTVVLEAELIYPHLKFYFRKIGPLVLHQRLRLGRNNITKNL